MRRITLLCAVLATCTGLNAFDASAQVTIRGPVEMRSERSLAEIAEYVDEVAQRLERGLYDEIEAQSLAWLEAETASLRGEVERAEQGAGLTEELRRRAGSYELGVITIDEGGVFCRSERRTGTRMREDRCYSNLRLVEERERSRDTLRRLRRPQVIGGRGS